VELARVVKCFNEGKTTIHAAAVTDTGLAAQSITTAQKVAGTLQVKQEVGNHTAGSLHVKLDDQIVKPR